MTVPSVHLIVGDAAVARIAGLRAARVPGVVSLRAEPARTLLGPAAARRRTDGVTAVVEAASAEVAITIVTRLGHHCLDLVQAVQRAVAAEVTALTGLRTTVRVTIADILLD